MSPALVIALVLGVAATVEDLRRRTLPNWLTMTGLAAGLLLAAPHGWRVLLLRCAAPARPMMGHTSTICSPRAT